MKDELTCQYYYARAERQTCLVREVKKCRFKGADQRAIDACTVVFARTRSVNLQEIVSIEVMR